MDKKKQFKLVKNNMDGGYGYYTYYWNEHKLFGNYNKENLDCLILNKNYNSSKTQFNKYSLILKELLNFKDGVINIQFISNFFRYIYYDIKNEYSLQKDGKIFKWVNEHNLNYKITKTINQPHGNTSILFLENDKKDKKVLKIFNNISISDNKNNDINLNYIKDYLSLEITRIGNDLSFQNNNFFITEADFELINFNKQKHFIKDQYDKDIILSCKNNDAINDYIINLILQQIEEDDNLNDFKYVKYHNLFVTKVDDNFRYCIIMDSMDGSIDGYINDNFDNLEVNDNNKKIYTIAMDNILNQAEKNLNYTKSSKYLFTHTDMKIENLFYKIVNNKLEVYLADFDKSSISYHNIRFYNDITKTNDKIKKILNNRGALFNILKKDSYTKKNINERIDNIHKHYRLSRFLVNLQSDINTKIEFEQLYMRYNFTPYYMSFDMCSLILSLFYYDKKNLIKLDELEILKRYIFNKINEIYDLYRNSHTLHNKKGNFGELLNIIIFSTLKYNYFIFYFLKNEYINIQNLYITNTNNKLCISYPLYNNNQNNIKIDDNIYITKFTSIEPNMINKYNIIHDNNYNISEIYQKYDNFNNENFSDINFDTKYIIEYNDDNYNIMNIGYSTLNNYYVKTNRYGYRKINYRISEYDNITEDEVYKIIDLFNKNNLGVIHKYENKDDENNNDNNNNNNDNEYDMIDDNGNGNGNGNENENEYEKIEDNNVNGNENEYEKIEDNKINKSKIDKDGYEILDNNDNDGNYVIYDDNHIINDNKNKNEINDDINEYEIIGDINEYNRIYYKFINLLNHDIKNNIDFYNYINEFIILYDINKNNINNYQKNDYHDNIRKKICNYYKENNIKMNLLQHT